MQLHSQNSEEVLTPLTGHSQVNDVGIAIAHRPGPLLCSAGNEFS